MKVPKTQGFWGGPGASSPGKTLKFEILGLAGSGLKLYHSLYHFKSFTIP